MLIHLPWAAFDISADLTELGKTPMAVVCAGAKSILDIELTLEYLVSASELFFMCNDEQQLTIIDLGGDKYI